jgi:Alpha 1,4-glycosyltransferase conserved region
MGNELSYLEKLCLTSIVSVGHRALLYCYDDALDVPRGVEIRNAAEIMPRESFFRHANGSYALGSDLFRYTLFTRFPCVWVDIDMLLLRPIAQQEDYIFGWEDANYINTAVLSIPPGSPMLHEIFELISETPFFAPWWDEKQIARQQEAAQRGAPISLTGLPWATTGPKLVTYLATKHDVASFALKPEIFYPVHWRDYRLPFEPGDQVTTKLGGHTIGVHLWNHMLGTLKKNPAMDSFIANQCRSHAIALPGIDGSDRG